MINMENEEFRNSTEIIKTDEEPEKREDVKCEKHETENGNDGTTGNKRGFVRRILRIIEFVILVLGIGFLVYMFVTTGKGKAVDLFGVNVLHVTTGSMAPTIEEGEYVLVKETDVNSLTSMDIIAYYSEAPDVYGQVVIHRIMDVNADGTFVTKGDANPVADELNVRSDQVLGKYCSEVWFFSWLSSFADPKKLMLVLAVIPLFLVTLYEFSTVTKVVYSIKKEKGAETAEEKIERLKKEAVEEYLRQQNCEKADDLDGEKRQNTEN